jgi:starvation-inducible outer membrane lipoprotein
MFFLLRMTFWLGLVCVLLPGKGEHATAPQIDAASAVSAAGAAVSDMRGFCDRQPQACVVGGKVAVALGQKAEAGARTLFDIVSAQLGSDAKPANDAKLIQASAPGTLPPADLAPNWLAPVPLPPRREARANRPAV